MKAATICAFLLCFSLSAGAPAEDTLKIDEKAATVSIAARVAEQGRYDVLKGSIEYLLVSEGGKSYETVFVTKVTPRELSRAFLKVGAKSGRPATDGAPPRGTPFRISVEYRSGDGKPARGPADAFILHKKSGKPLKPTNWIFTGSARAFDPETEKQVLQATITKSLIGLHYTDASPLIQNPRAEAKDENIYRTNVKTLPKPGTAVRLIFQRVPLKDPKGRRRVHVFLTGRVQGVGFRNFTRRQALRLGLIGWVMNLRDGRVEAVVEGPAEKVAALLEKIKRGPRGARVVEMKVADETPRGKFKTFRVLYARP